MMDGGDSSERLLRCGFGQRSATHHTERTGADQHQENENPRNGDRRS